MRSSDDEEEKEAERERSETEIRKGLLHVERNERIKGVYFHLKFHEIYHRRRRSYST